MTPGVPAGAASVAVLPFVNMSSDPEQEYFSDGLSEEILNALARIPGLYVPARTSSFQFKGKSGDVAKFAAMLGVAAVLEGSVRKAGSSVRITAQLINAADGYHLWSQTYDRELKDIFAVQREISDAIAAALRLRLTPEAKLAAFQAPMTANMDAYEAYLLGRHEFNKGRASVARSIEYFHTAVELDPKFAVAMADLAVAVIMDGWSRAGMKYSDERERALEKARGFIERAEALEPDRAEVLAARGFWERDSGYARPEGLQRALEFFDRSLVANPSSGQVLTWRNQTLNTLGQFERLLPATSEAIKRDPVSLDALDFRIRTLLGFGRRAEVGPLVDRVRSLDEGRGQRWFARIAESYDGDYPAAIRYCVAAAQANESAGRGCGFETFAALGLRHEVFANAGNEAAGHIMLGEVEDAVRLAREAYDSDPAWWEWDLVLWYWVLGDYRSSWEFLQRAQRSDARGTGYTGWNRSPALLLATADTARRLGHAERAVELRARAEERVEAQVSAAAPFESDNFLERAMLAAYDGQDAEAAALLAKGMRAGWNGRFALSMPLFENVRKRDDFQATMAELRTTRDRQRAEVLKILCGSGPLPAGFRPQPQTCAEWKS